MQVVIQPLTTTMTAQHQMTEKSTMSDIPGCPSPLQNEGVLEAVNKLTELVEYHPQFHSKLEQNWNKTGRDAQRRLQ